MANAVFNSYEDYLSKNTSNPVQHNTFDLSHIRSFTTTYGALIPFYLEDCLPSDHFDISNIVRVQSLPMSNPLLNNIKVQTWYFYVPYYLLWRKFDLFISGGRDGTYTASIPMYKGSFSVNSLGDYLGFPVAKDPYDSNHPAFEVNAFPFAAYQRIYRDFFLNQDIQTVSNANYWFPADDDDFSLHDGMSYVLNKNLNPAQYVQFDSGDGNQLNSAFPNSSHFVVSILEAPGGALAPALSKDYPWLGLIRFRNFQRDYFTSAMFSPQRGPAMGLGMSNQSPFTASDFNDIFNSHPENTPEILGLSSGSLVSLESSGDVSDGRAYIENFTSPSNFKSVFARLFNTASVKLSSAITISDIMTASQVQLWMERNMQVKAQYNEFLRVHFGDAPLDERLTRPYYIGGSSQYINVNAVVQTSESGTTPQGTMTGLGSTKDSQFIGKFTSHEYGLIMGIMCIMPDVFYTDGTDKRWMKASKFDFVFPELAQLPPEPIFNYEIYDTANYPSRFSVFGYSGRYDLYRHRMNLAVGDLRSSRMSDFSSWIIRRSFSSFPSLNSWDFICTLKTYGGVTSLPPCYDDTTVTPNVHYDLNNIPMSHFPTGNLQNPFIVQVGLRIKASRPLPYRNEPQTLNLRRG